MTPYDVLWITTEGNPAPRAGGGLRSLRLVQAAAHDLRVHVLNLGVPFAGEEYCRVSGAVSAQGVAPQASSSLTRLLRSVARLRPLAPTRVANPLVRTLVEQAEREGALIVYEHTVTLDALPREVPYVVALHNVDSEVLFALGRPRGLRGVLNDYERWATCRLERRLTADPRALVIAVSERDAELLGPGVHVVANGADVPAVVTPLPSEGSVAFLASMGYPPNEDAVRWWASEIFPLGGVPRLAVAGLRSREVLADLATDPAVRLAGEIDSPAAWLSEARVVALPLRAGGGTRLKLVEALAHGRPVVSTTKGAEGFPVRSGQHLLLADTPADFAAAVRRLLSDDDLAASLAQAGRELAEAYAWPKLGRQFVELIRSHRAA